jgi:hypothetical protein
MRATKVGLLILMAGIAINAHAAVVTNWVANPGFESPTSNTYPDEGTTPWVAQENAVWPVQREQTIVHSGTNAVVYQYYGNTDTIRQDLPEGITVDTNAMYEMRFWMRIDEQSGNAAHTNDTVVQAMINTTTNGVYGGPYKWKATEYNLAPSAPGVWEEQVIHFDASGWTALQGEYIRIALKKSYKPSEYRPFIDDVQFGVYEPDAPSTNVLIGFYGCNGGTNDYTAPGIEGVVFLDKAYQKNSNAGSTDGTYGSTNGADIRLTGYEVRMGDDPVNNQRNAVGFKIVNKTGAPLQLDSISFDYAPWWTEGPKDVILTYEWGNLSGVTQGTVVASASGLVNLGVNKGDYHDFDWSVAGLADTVLSGGETAAFRLTATNASGIWSSGAFDNIAVMGGAYSGSGYDAWAGDYGLTGGALGDDDNDGIDNLTEYAQDGDPTNGAVTGTLPMTGEAFADGGGTNWIEYIYVRRTTAGHGLTYTLEQCYNLPGHAWSNHADIVKVGESVPSGGFKYVTNNVPTDGKNLEFIRLNIEN